MSKKIIWASIFLSLVLFSNSGLASSVLDWPTCLALAKTHNKTLLAAQLDLLQASSNLQLVKAGLGPSVSLSSQYNQAVHSSGNTSAKINISQELFPALWQSPEVTEGTLKLQAAHYDFLDTKASIIHDLYTAYIEVLYQQALLELNTKIVTRRKANMDLVHAKYQSGSEHIGDQEWSDAQYQQAQLIKKQNQRKLDLAKQNLQQLIGTTVPIVTKGPIESHPLISRPSIAQLTLEVPIIKKSAALIEAANATIKIQEKENGALLVATLSAGKNFSGAPDDSVTGSLAFSMPIFQNGKAELQIAIATQKRDQLRLNHQNLLSKTQLDLETKYTNWATSIENLIVQASFLKAAEKRAEIEQAKYSLGLSTYENWDAVENNLITQRTQIVNQQKEAALAYIQWRAGLGQE